VAKDKKRSTKRLQISQLSSHWASSAVASHNGIKLTSYYLHPLRCVASYTFSCALISPPPFQAFCSASKFQTFQCSTAASRVSLEYLQRISFHPRIIDVKDSLALHPLQGFVSSSGHDHLRAPAINKLPRKAGPPHTPQMD